MIKLKILTLLCSVFISFNLYADDDYHQHKKFEEYKNKFYNYSKYHHYKNFEYLELNKNQKDKLKNILIEYKKSYKKFYEYKHIKEQELAFILKNENIDIERYKKIDIEINSYALDLEITNLKNIHDILNKEQREKFSYYLKEWRVE